MFLAVDPTTYALFISIREQAHRARCEPARAWSSALAPGLPPRCPVSHVRSLTDVTLSPLHRHRHHRLGLRGLHPGIPVAATAAVILYCLLKIESR